MSQQGGFSLQVSKNLIPCLPGNPTANSHWAYNIAYDHPHSVSTSQCPTQESKWDKCGEFSNVMENWPWKNMLPKKKMDRIFSRFASSPGVDVASEWVGGWARDW